MTLNNRVRSDGSGSAAQMFFGHTPRSVKFGLVTPAKVDREQLAEARSKSHRDMRERTKGNRKLEQFVKNDRIFLQDDKTGCFDQKATVIGPRNRRSEDPRTFHIKKNQSSEVLLRNKRHFRRMPVSPGSPGVAGQDTLHVSPPLTVQSRPRVNSAEQDTVSDSAQVPAQPRTWSEHARAERESHTVQPVVVPGSHSQQAEREQWCHSQQAEMHFCLIFCEIFLC